MAFKEWIGNNDHYLNEPNLKVDANEDLENIRQGIDERIENERRVSMLYDKLCELSHKRRLLRQFPDCLNEDEIENFLQLNHDEVSDHLFMGKTKICSKI